MEFPRNAEGVKCDCGGYAAIVDVTPQEEIERGCGRPGCCARAYVCGVCHTRIVGTAEAPEPDYS